MSSSRFNVTRRGPIWFVQDRAGDVVFHGPLRTALEWVLERTDAAPPSLSAEAAGEAPHA